MSRILILCERDTSPTHWLDIHGQPLLARYPGRVLMFADAQACKHYPQAPNCMIEGIEYMAEARMLEMAQRHHAADPIDAVCTLDERSVEIAARLRQALGLPGLPPLLARRYRDKVLMKEIVAAAGLRVPQFCGFNEHGSVDELLRRHGALVVKPRDGQGSRNVSFVRSPAELERLRARTREAHRYEAEEFIEGTLYHVNSVVIDGEVRFTAVAPYLPGMANIDYTSGTPFVTLMLTEGPLLQRLSDFSARAITALGLRDGVTHLEAFHSERDEIVFCETAVRPGGGGIVQMIEAQYGVNMALAAMLSETGRGAQALASLAPQTQLFGVMGLRNAGMGRVQMDIDEHSFAFDWLRQLTLEVRPGQVRPPSAHCTDFLGLALIAAADEAQFRHRVAELQQRFDATVRLAPL